MEQTRLSWLLTLQAKCAAKNQKLSRVKLDELNSLLINELVAHNTFDNGTRKDNQ